MKLSVLAVILMIPLISPVSALSHQDKSQRKGKNLLKDAINMPETSAPSVEFAGSASGPRNAPNQQMLNHKTALKILPKSYGNQWNKYLYQPSEKEFPSGVDSEGGDIINGQRNGLMDVKANKRNPAVVAGAKALLRNPNVQEAVVEKGIDVAGKLIDKQLQIIEDAQQKAADFLKKEIKLDITPDKGWESEDMFVPPGYHIDAAVEGGQTAPKEGGQVPYVFPSGVGSVLMNGCWGTVNTEPNDPCDNSKRASTICSNMIDGAAFLGVGFDGRGKHSPESRKMSIVQRNCANKATYGGLDVPDTMNVHGIYDTSASLITFESREEYSKFIQQEAGISGSYFGFSAGVKEAWGESTQSSRQKYMAVLDVDVDRYEIFMDEVKPNDLSLTFLREFMALPKSYFAAGAPLRYQNYIQRWGTHFIKSSKFGGQLEIRKTMDAQDAKSKKDFEIQMELEFKTLFASVGAKAAAQENEAARKQTKTTSTSVLAQGGSQEIASILSDVYSPTFKTEFKEWLRTIPAFPKAFRFQMGSITELLNFRASDLFPEEKVNWGCEGNAENLLTDEKDGKMVKYYEVAGLDGKKTKYYCDYDSRQALEDAFQLRRTSLKRAIEIYMEEGPISISNIQLGECAREKKTSDVSSAYSHPSWREITRANSVFEVAFDMLDDLPSSIRKALDIQRNASFLVRFSDKRWRTSDRLGKFHLYGGFDNGESKDVSRRKMSILGLVLTFNEADGTLILSPEDYKASKKFFPTLGDEMTGIQFARVQNPHLREVKRKDIPEDTPLEPCKVDWSNALRLDPTDRNGKCLHFTASTEGTIFVVFAALPKDDTTWYFVEISPSKVATYKGKTLKTQTTNVNARALGDASLYQSYFVCITETERSTLIEYGKGLGTSDSGDVYLNLIDSEDHLNVRFYAFGNDEKPVKVMDAHLVSRALTKAECKGDTVRDKELDICVQNCHKDCDPYAGCKQINNSAVPEGCYACRVALHSETKKCIPECPTNKTVTKDKICVSTFDVLLKPSADFGPIKIGDIPALHELTICAWLRLEGTWGGKSGDNVFLVHYRHQTGSPADNFFSTRIQGSYVNKGGIDFFFDVPKSGSYRLEVNELNDGNWHQICVSWSGLSGVAIYYKTGKRLLSATYQKGELSGGGNLMIGGMIGGGSGKRQVTIHTTGVNLWKRILSDQEIAKNAEKCDSGEGDAKPWHFWYEVAKAKSGFLQEPSKCEAPTSASD